LLAEVGRGCCGLRMVPISFKRHRFPPEIIQHAVWLYARFSLSFRDVEDLLGERGIDASNGTLRRGFLKFGRMIAVNLRRGRPCSQCALAPRRDGNQGPWPEALVVARCRRRGARLLGPAPTLRQVCELIAPKAAEEAGLRVKVRYHGQAQILRCSHRPGATYSYS
jgi:hypothetical protein